MVRRAPTQREMPVQVDAREEPPERSGLSWLAWLVWALLALGLAFAFWLLLNACGIRWLHGMPLLYFCPAPVAAPATDPALGAEIARQRQLEAEIERLELALLGAPPCTPPATQEVEAIPKEAWREQDVGFLEGCWDLDSDYALMNESTRVTVGVASWRTCFDAGGNGQQSIVFADGSTCSGPVRAEFGAGDALILRDAGNVPCAAGSFISFIYRRVVTCERIDAQHAQCITRHVETGGSSNVILRRAAPE